MEIDLVRLRSFLEVAERGTVASASEALGYTPPAVSQHLSKLGRDLGAALFDRIGGRLKLTPAGEALVPIAKDMVNLVERAQVAAVSAPPYPRVTLVGIASAIAALVVPNVHRLAEMASLNIVEAEDEPALRELRLGHADVALVQEYPGDDVDRDPRLTYSVVARDELRLVLPASMPASTTVTDLVGTSWLLNGRMTRCAAATRQILRGAGAVDPEIRGDITDNHTLIGLVASGHGVTIVPDLVLADTGATVTIATQHLGVSRTLLAVSRMGPPAALPSIIDILSSPSTRGTVNVIEARENVQCGTEHLFPMR